MVIQLKFESFDILEIQIESTETAKTFFNFFKMNLTDSLPICKDPLEYDWRMFEHLVDKVVTAFGWNWTYDDIKKADLVLWHKDLERCLEKTGEMDQIPHELHQLVIDTHFCLHKLQTINAQKDSRQRIQIEWYTSDRRLMPEDIVFKRNISFGDVILQNPYVGHDPITCFFQDDYKNISRTCAFHDIITPGFFIQLKDSPWTPGIQQNYIDWYQQKCADFVQQVGMQTIMKYTGYPVVGKVTNFDLLQKIQNSNNLKLENVTTV